MMTRNQRNALLSAMAVLIALVFGLFGGYFDDLLRRTGIEIAGLPKPAADEPSAPAPTSEAAAPAPAAATDPAPAAPVDLVIPVFDIVRVEPTGDAVIAGQATPDTTVDILSGQTVVASGKSNESGEFAIVLTEPLKAGAHDLRARVTAPDGTVAISEQSVDVAVPENGLGEVLVVLNQPGAASTILQLPKSTETEVATAPTTPPASPASEAPDARPAPDVVTPALVEPETTVTAPAPLPAPPAAVATPAPAPTAPAPTSPAPTSPALNEPPAVAAAPAAAPPAAAPAPTEITRTEPTATAPAPAASETVVAAGPEAPAPLVAPAPQSAPAPAAAEAGSAPSAAAPPAVAAVPPEPAPAPVVVEPAPPPIVPTTVEAVELENGKRFFAAGAAAPGSAVRLYVDDALVADSRTAPSGRWLVEADLPLPPGAHTVRVDQIGPDGTVLSRAEVPFAIAEVVADAATPPTGVASFGTLSAGSGSAASTSIGPGQSVIIRRGDNLWTIAKRLYGNGIRFSTIYEANNDQIRNPNLIYPGQVFVIPEGDLNWPAEAAPLSRGG